MTAGMWLEVAETALTLKNLRPQIQIQIQFIELIARRLKFKKLNKQ